jgi:secondary thiamine-phosphate synthase enzyme
VREITIKTERHTEVVDITARVQEALDTANGATAALVYVPHTTAGVTINEHADPALKSDIENALEQIVDEGWPWQHHDADGPNGPSHVRASLMSPQVLVPLRDDQLALGTWQGIFFCEFDGPRERKVYVTALH